MSYASTKAWRERNPEKVKANRIVFSAKRNRTLIPKPCEICGDSKSESHH